jgi:hypothetical protein
MNFQSLLVLVLFLPASAFVTVRGKVRDTGAFRDGINKMRKVESTTRSPSSFLFQSNEFYGDVIPVAESFDPQLPLPQAATFAFILVTFSLLRMKVLGIQECKEDYEKKTKELKAVVLLGLSEPSNERSEEILKIEAEVEASRMAWERAKEIAPGIRVASPDPDINTEAQRQENGANEMSRVTDPATLVLLGAVALVLISTLTLTVMDPMKGGWDGRMIV